MSKLSREMSHKIDLIRALIQVEGKCTLDMTWNNYNSEGGVCFSGRYYDSHDEAKAIKFTIDKNELEILEEAEECEDILEMYYGFEFFKET